MGGDQDAMPQFAGGKQALFDVLTNGIQVQPEQFCHFFGRVGKFLILQHVKNLRVLRRPDEPGLEPVALTGLSPVTYKR